VFCAYVGAVFSQSGQEVVGKWIELLVQYHEQQQNTSLTPTIAMSSMTGGMESDVPVTKKTKHGANGPSLASFGGIPPVSSTMSTSTSTSPSSTLAAAGTTVHAYSPTAPYLNASQQYPAGYSARQLPPHLQNKTSLYPQLSGGGPTGRAPPQPQMSLSALYQSLAKLSQSPALKAITANQAPKTSVRSVMNPIVPATPNAPFLPTFNTLAAQRGVKVEYVAEFRGPAHAGEWSVQCRGECFSSDG